MAWQFKLTPLPHIIRTKRIEGWQAGKAKGALITIDSDHATNKRLYKHELVHVMQFYALGVPLATILMLIGTMFPLWLFGFLLYGLGYTFIPYFRMVAEAMAYGIAAHYSDDSQDPVGYMHMGAKSLATQYKLPEKSNKERCLKYIEKFYNIWDKVK